MAVCEVRMNKALSMRMPRHVLLSTIGPRDLPERQQTMNATVAWSYQMLGPNEQRVFRRLARCRVGFRSKQPPPSLRGVRVLRRGATKHSARPRPDR